MTQQFAPQQLQQQPPSQSPAGAPTMVVPGQAAPPAPQQGYQQPPALPQSPAAAPTMVVPGQAAPDPQQGYQQPPAGYGQAPGAYPPPGGPDSYQQPPVGAPAGYAPAGAPGAPGEYGQPGNYQPQAAAYEQQGRPDGDGRTTAPLAVLGALLMIGGGIFYALSPFLTWISAKSGGSYAPGWIFDSHDDILDFSSAGMAFRRTGGSTILGGAVALIGLMIIISALGAWRLPASRWKSAAVTLSLLVAGNGLWTYFTKPDIGQLGDVFSWGIGMLANLIGPAVVLVGAVIVLFAPVRQKDSSTPPPMPSPQMSY